MCELKFINLFNNILTVPASHTEYPKLITN